MLNFHSNVNMSQSSFLVGLALLASFYFCGISCQRPGLLKSCHSHDITCLTEVTQNFLAKTAKAIPSFSLKGIDPVVIDFMEYPIHVDLKLRMEKVFVTGFRNLKIVQFLFNKESKSVVLKVETEVSSRGNCETLGENLVRNGTFTGKVDAVITAKYNYTLVKNDNGEEFFKVGPEDIDVLLKGDLSKVFEVDKQVEDEIKKVDVNLEDLKKSLTNTIITMAYRTVIQNLRTIGLLHPKEAFFTDL